MVLQARRPALTEVLVTPLRRRHLRQVLAIERACYPAPWSPALFTAELSASGRCYLVAVAPSSSSRWRRREVVGYAGFLMQAGDAHISTVAVHPAHHRRKIASRLLVRLLLAAREMGADAATLEVRASNLGAQRLYGRFGFRPVGVRPRYYGETGEDALIMWHHDLQSDATAALLAGEEARLVEPGGASGEPDHEVSWVQGRIGLEAHG
jgi:[ribosomal protein S18]-alanine N-acetyltransferase